MTDVYLCTVTGQPHRWHRDGISGEWTCADCWAKRDEDGARVYVLHAGTYIELEHAQSMATVRAEAEVERLREAIASAAISIASGPARDDYAYRVLTEALDG